MIAEPAPRLWIARGLVAGALIFAAVPPALAERADSDKPMQIESNALRYESRQQRSIFTGNVIVTKGTIVMRGARLVVDQDAAGRQSATMYAQPGERAFFRQKRDGVNEFIEGEGQTITYNGAEDTVRLVGRAEMRRLVGATVQDKVMGSVIVYNNKTEVYTVQSDSGATAAQSAAPGGRVRAILAPRPSGADAQDPGATPSKLAVPLQSSGTLPRAKKAP